MDHLGAIAIYLMLLGLIVSIIYHIYFKPKYNFEHKLIAHYQQLGYDVISVDKPGFLNPHNPWSIEFNAPVFIIDGFGALSDKTIIKKVTLQKDDRTLIVWVRMTIKNKTIEFESKPNIE